MRSDEFQAADSTAVPLLRGPLDDFIAGAVSLLFVWRLLAPTEGAALGEGLPMVQFSLGVLVLWAVRCWRRGCFEARLEKIDIAASAFVLGHVIAAVIALSQEADQRATINMICEWSGLGATFFLLRQTARTEIVRRQIVVVVLAVTAVLAVLGIWQHFIWYPAAAAQYKEVRDEFAAVLQQPLSTSREGRARRLREQLRELGVPDEAHQGRSRMNFEARLYSSTEPLGRFALANTFAGLLVVWQVVLLAVLARRWGEASEKPVALTEWIAGGFVLLLVTYCLILTKSRTAYVASLVGMGVVVGGFVWRAAKFTRRTVLTLGGGGILVAGLIAIAAWTGGLDRWVVSEAEKSLRYRLEYWGGTWQVIKTHPVWGIGPGNFRGHYLEHKFAESSEEIADPHNLVLDVWVNGGLLALGGLFAIGVLSARSLVGREGAKAENHSDLGLRGSRKESKAPPGRVMIPLPPLIYCGGAVVFLSMLVINPNLETLGLLVLWLAAIPACSHALGTVSLRPVLFGGATIALAIHLLGAGGIAMPAICQTLFLLLVLMQPRFDAPPRPKRASRVALAGNFMAVSGLFLGCWYFGTGPVASRTEAIATGDFEVRQRGNLEKGRQAYMRAATADRFSAEPWRKLAELEFGQWIASHDGGEEEMGRAVTALEKTIEKNPRSWTDYRILGEYHLRAFNRSQQRKNAIAAVDSLGRAVELYPNHAELRGRFAVALAYAKETEAARREAAFALKLHEITAQAGHVDRLLPEQTLKLLHQIAENGLPPGDLDDTD